MCIFHSVVNVGGVPQPTTYVSATGLKVTGTATAAQVGTQLPVTVTNTGLGAVTTAAVQLSVTAAAPIKVTVAPTSANVAATATRQFTATVTGTTTTTVTWSVNGMAGGNAMVGTISGSGLYKAPAAVPQAGQAVRPGRGVAEVCSRPRAPRVERYR